ncbi:sarcosine oxidase subunit delta [uncultured Roseovarius sp.]|uniref:sarcosine oxidase subunit delta n=1 Tax=uncultured Roseovarius sp. TaxID=293344 RepID=UPI00345BA423
MQIFICPFCGPRDEREFHFEREAGKIRPDTTKLVSDIGWSDYLNEQRNTKGAVREVWSHLPCHELFVMERNSLTMDVIYSTSRRGPVT